MDEQTTEIQKTDLRKTLFHNRRHLEDKDRLSDAIWENLRTLPAFARAETIMTYLHLPEEVRTNRVVEWARESGKRLVVPYCDKPGLGLFLHECPTELLPGVYSVLEPTEFWKSQSERRVLPEQLDVILVPGAGFDRGGGRIGYGKAYYDNFLKTVPSRVPTIGLAFECQMVDAIPLEPHDRRVDYIVIEREVIETKIHCDRANNPL